MAKPDKQVPARLDVHLILDSCLIGLPSANPVG